MTKDGVLNSGGEDHSRGQDTHSTDSFPLDSQCLRLSLDFFLNEKELIDLILSPSGQIIML